MRVNFDGKLKSFIFLQYLGYNQYDLSVNERKLAEGQWRVVIYRTACVFRLVCYLQLLKQNLVLCTNTLLSYIIRFYTLTIADT